MLRNGVIISGASAFILRGVAALLTAVDLRGATVSNAEVKSSAEKSSCCCTDNRPGSASPRTLSRRALSTAVVGASVVVALLAGGISWPGRIDPVSATDLAVVT